MSIYICAYPHMRGRSAFLPALPGAPFVVTFAPVNKA